MVFKSEISQFMEVMHRRNARIFLHDLRAKGFALRTVENYRSVLTQLWKHVAELEAELLKRSPNQKSFETSIPIENPWKDLKIPEAKARRSPSRLEGERQGRANSEGLLKGPNATKKYATMRAYRLRMTLKDLLQKGIVSNGGIARALNEMGERTPRGGLWDATGVRRLKERCKWDS